MEIYLTYLSAFFRIFFMCDFFSMQGLNYMISMISWLFRESVGAFFAYFSFILFLLLASNLFHLVLFSLLNSHSFVTSECYLTSFCLFVCFVLEFFFCWIFYLLLAFSFYLPFSLSCSANLHFPISPLFQWQSNAITWFGTQKFKSS